MYLRHSEGSSRFRKSYMNKLMGLAVDLEDVKGYPELSPRVVHSVVQIAVGKDPRTVQKYLKAVKARSKMLGGAWVVKWDVSPFVKEVYRCHHSDINPKHVFGGA